jgi:hypothetical protein
MFFVGLCAWVIFPGAALLAGGVPAHYFSGRLDTRQIYNR